MYMYMYMYMHMHMYGKRPLYMHPTSRPPHCTPALLPVRVVPTGAAGTSEGDPVQRAYHGDWLCGRPDIGAWIGIWGNPNESRDLMNKMREPPKAEQL